MDYKKDMEDKMYLVLAKYRRLTDSGESVFPFKSALDAMKELHNIIVKSTLKYAADNGQVDNIGKEWANHWVIDKEEMLDLEKDLLI